MAGGPAVVDHARRLSRQQRDQDPLTTCLLDRTTASIVAASSARTAVDLVGAHILPTFAKPAARPMGPGGSHYG
jgi:hypothetical protein